jgi:integrase
METEETKRPETKVKLTDTFFETAKVIPGKQRTIFWDTNETGFGLMVTAQGAKSYIVQYRNAGRQSRRMKIKDVRGAAAARRIAKSLFGEVANRRDPLAERRKEEAKATNTLKSIAEDYFKRKGKDLRSVEIRKRVFERAIFPTLGTRSIESIRKSDVVKLLDQVEDKSGQTAADQTLAFLRRLFSWHATRSDEFRSPIVRGMARSKPKERARIRSLTDDEIRALWTATATGLYGALVRFLLLTGARRDEARNMPWSEIDDVTCADTRKPVRVWILPPHRHKTGKTNVEKVLPLSKAAQSVLAEVPALGPFVFSVNGRKPIAAPARVKTRLDKASGVTGWRIHDLRRTARSLMPRAGVDADIAERCLGHVIGGVRGVYDRHEYLEEKRLAFERLATLIEGIVNPQESAVADAQGAEPVPA